MLGVFPDLKEAAITHSWSGYVAFAEDFLPHFGEVQGIHYAAPYNGSGVAMATYLGHRVALRLLGLAAPGSSLDAIPHKAPFPGYSGKPWFLPIVGQYYKLRDWMDRRGV
jgi:glycine/D-amino acid oxidase-like deaminating enzyme